MTSNPRAGAPERMSCAVGRPPVDNVIDLVAAARAGSPQRMTMLRSPLPMTSLATHAKPAKPERAP